jgi:hypothetical protein
LPASGYDWFGSGEAMIGISSEEGNAIILNGVSMRFENNKTSCHVSSAIPECYEDIVHFRKEIIKRAVSASAVGHGFGCK